MDEFILPLKADALLFKVLAEKATRGYQLGFRSDGYFFYGFPSGLDEDWIQILEIPKVVQYTDPQPKASYDFSNKRYVLLSINSITAVVESPDSLADFDKEHKEEIRKGIYSFTKQCREYLKRIKSTEE